jgi:RNA polymerase sigma factor (sigma-70 family)
MRPPNRHAATIEKRHRRHDPLVLSVLSKEGVPPAEIEGEAQEVWLTVYRKLTSGEPEPDSWPAYLTALAQGRAANHRRAARHRRAGRLPDEPGTVDRQLSAEQVVILYGVIDSIPSPDQREAALLRMEGYSIAEIATKQGISEAGVKKRLKMAGEHLEKELERDEGEKGDDDEKDEKKKAGAFWGFGSFEALIDALAEESERRWKDIEEAIREIETPPGPPASSLPPTLAPLLLASPPNAAPGLGATAGKLTLIAAFGGALLGGASYLGAQHGAERDADPVAACPELPASPNVPLSGPPPPSQEPLPAGTMAARPPSLSGSTTKPGARPHAAPDDVEGLRRRTREDRAGVGQ